jgi:hypothetical protein
MTRRFWIALLLVALGLGALLLISYLNASGDDGPPDADVREVVGAPAATP